MYTSIVAETAQCFSTHQFACLIGYGARSVFIFAFETWLCFPFLGNIVASRGTTLENERTTSSRSLQLFRLDCTAVPEVITTLKPQLRNKGNEDCECVDDRI